MGIREEIEKLESYRHRILTYEYETINKADVLSILDEHLGECVMEKQFPDDDLSFAEMYEFVLDCYEATKAGDHISIYVRRKNESSS